jgi:hypothetical protein
MKKKIEAGKSKGGKKIGGKSRGWDINNRIDLTQKDMRDLGLGSFESGRGSVKGCCRIIVIQWVSQREGNFLSRSGKASL